MGRGSGSEFNIFTRWYYSWKGKRLYNKQINDLPYVKVKHPISGEVICLGDLFCESLYDGIAIKNILEGYGIKYLGNAIDFTASPVVETLAKMGKSSHFIDGFGNTIGHNEIMPEIMPSSNLGILKEYVNNYNGDVRSLAGHVAETKIFYHLNENGILTEMPDTSNAAGYDLKVEKSFFDETGLPYVKAPDSELGILQVKSVEGPGDILKHFKKYPDIPVVCPDDVIDENSLIPYRHLIRGFEEAGLNGIERVGIVNETHQALVLIKETADENFSGIIPAGSDISIIRENIEGCYGFDLDDSIDVDWFGDDFEIQIPYLGAAIVFALACKKNYSLYKADKINLLAAAGNVSGNTVLNALGAMGGAAAGLGAAHILGYNGREELFNAALTVGHPAGDFGEIASNEYDFDFDDACEIAELVAVVAVAWYAAKSIKKGIKAAYNKIKAAIFGDPEEALKNAKRVLLQTCFEAFYKYYANKKLIYNALGGWIVDHNEKQKSKLKFRLKALKTNKNTIELSFLKYAQNKTNKQKEIPKANIFDAFNNSLERCSVLDRFYVKPNPENIKAVYSANSKFYSKDICTAVDDIIKNLSEKSIEAVKELIIIEVRYMTSILEGFFKAGKRERGEEYVSDINEVLGYCEAVKSKYEAYKSEHEKLYGAQAGN